ncbi:AraC family transcriptional regulator ligand-binding domain-containing protein [Acinetobacter sp.]|jgi:AraC-like DNA-binding protein|uniref:AraC family transcriptional regulator n=1 Tax=Acinetobacter sp. TaxID=472 RepID=UPI0028206658|nr:AraC family transcriptional regulator ligand-binding domain-containing protein [Acinetobacter sp.]MDR2251122.1 AraC family transcriptional regulator [Acinetobacter sp.]
MLEFQDYLRAPSSVQLLLEFGEQLKIQKAQLLAGTGLSFTRLNDANSVITPDEELGVINNLIHILSFDTAGLGLIIGFRHQLTTYGILGYALMSSATGLDAMKLVQRYLALTYTFVKINFSDENDECIISFTEPVGLTSELQRFVLERAMGATLRVIRDIYEGSFQLNAFHLKDLEPKHCLIPIPKEYLNVPIEFGQKSNILKFNKFQLQHELPHANSNTAAMCERLCMELITQRHTTLTTTMIVRDFLSNAPSGTLLNLNDIATKLNMSERTLKRKLQDENTSFRTLQNETLHERANTLLAKDLSLSQIAETLGFSDLSTFSQAYKRWTGIAPSHYKKRKIK